MSTVTLDKLVDPVDESPHVPQPDRDLPFRENWWLSFDDPESGLSGTAHITMLPNQRSLRCALHLLDGQREFKYLRYSDAVAAAGADTVDDGSFRLEIVNPENTEKKHLRFTVSLPEASVVLDVRGRYRAVELAQSVPGLLPTNPDGHFLNFYMQPVIVDGEIQEGRRRRAFSAFGLRDRSWGFREDASTWQEVICACVFTPSLAGAGALTWHAEVAGDRPAAGGFMLSADGSALVRDVAIERDDFLHASRLRLGSADGTKQWSFAVDQPVRITYLPFTRSGLVPWYREENLVQPLRDEDTGEAGTSIWVIGRTFHL